MRDTYRLQYLSLVDKGWPVVLLDVDSKQSESALRGPPPAFVTEDFLKALRCVIHPRGMYICVLQTVEFSDAPFCRLSN